MGFRTKIGPEGCTFLRYCYRTPVANKCYTAAMHQVNISPLHSNIILFGQTPQNPPFGIFRYPKRYHHNLSNCESKRFVHWGANGSHYAIIERQNKTAEFDFCLSSNNFETKNQVGKNHNNTSGSKENSNTDDSNKNNGNYGEYWKKILVALGGVAFGWLAIFSLFPTFMSLKAKTVENAGNKSSGKSRRTELNFMAEVVQEVTPAVVYLEVIGQQYVPFLGKAVNVSNGSGFLISSDGLIITNAHVVGGHAQKANKVTVKLQDGTVYNGRVESVATNSDLATVRIDAKNLPVLSLANSEEAKLGEFVLAVGSPLFLSNSVSFGIISGLRRRMTELGKPLIAQRHLPYGIGNTDMGTAGKQPQYIQTDAAINVGNSGGPLVNLDGEVVGVNSMTVSQPSTTGISFAIPASDVKHFIESPEFKRAVQSHKGRKKESWWGDWGKEKKGGGENLIPKREKYLGLQMMSLSPEVVQELQFWDSDFPSTSKGVLVSGVYVGSPAHMVGIEPGDVITHIKGKAVENAGDVLNAVNEMDELEFTVLRNRQSIVVKVTPDEVMADDDIW